jgi:hypothetical protein
MGFMGLESKPDFSEVSEDIKGLSSRFTKEYEAKKKELKKKLKAQKKETKQQEEGQVAASPQEARDEL